MNTIKKIFNFSTTNFRNVAFMFMFILILLFTFGYIFVSSSADSTSIYASIDNYNNK